jgi:hypothetical protein
LKVAFELETALGPGEGVAVAAMMSLCSQNTRLGCALSESGNVTDLLRTPFAKYTLEPLPHRAVAEWILYAHRLLFCTRPGAADKFWAASEQPRHPDG